MKQHISIECLNQLSEEQKNKLRELWEPKFGDMFCYKQDWNKDIEIDIVESPNCLKSISDTEHNSRLPLLSIGQMIEILEKECHIISTISSKTYQNEKGYDSTVIISDESVFHSNELCDALWKAVLSIL